MKHRFTLLFALLCASIMGWAYTSDPDTWIGSTDATYSNQFKWLVVEGMDTPNDVVNIQKPGFAAEIGIYMNFPDAAFNAVYMNGVLATNEIEYKQDGAGIVIYLSALSAKNTEIVIKQGETIRWGLNVYNAKGEGEGGEGSEGSGVGSGSESGVIDWSSISWLDNGAGKYKLVVEPEIGDGFGGKRIEGTNLWVGFPSAAFGTMSIEPSGGEGAWRTFALSNFLKRENKFTVVCEGTTYTFTVYYADGQEGEGGGEGTESEPTEIWDVNFALQSQGATATAKSGNNPGEANDGNEGSRWWSATGTDEAPMTEEEEHNQWWQVNLGQRRIFNTIQILWEGAWGKSFDIQISDDGAAWTTVKQIRDQNIAGPFPYLQTIELDEKKTAQYVRFQGIERGTGYAYSFWEFRVLLPNVSVLTTIDLKAGTNIAKVGGDGIVLTTTAKDQNGNPMSGIEITYVVTPAAAGSVEGGKYIPEKIGEATIVAKSGEVTSDAIQVFGVNSDNLALNKPATAGHDNANANLSNNANTEDRWGSNGATHYNGGENSEFGDWWYVDLGVKYDINGIAIRWETARPNDYDIRVSDDAITWTNIGTFNDYPVANVYEFYQGLSAVPGRYIGVWARNGHQNLAYGISMYDFQAFGTPAATPTKTVSASVNDAAMGSATVKQGGAEVTEVETGSEVTFSAVANDGYVFVEWSNGEKNATFTTTVDAALNLTATFRKLGTTYCNTLVQSTNGGQGHDAYVTMKRTAENEYTLVVRSVEAMLNFGGINFYMQPNIHVIDLRDKGTLSADKRTLSVTFTAEKEPYMTTPLYVVLDGGFEAHFPQLTNIEYTVSCEDNVEVESIALEPAETTIEVGGFKTLVPIFTPAYAINQIVSWSSSDESKVSVSTDGVIGGNAEGEAIITATSANGKIATCNVTVNTISEKTWWGLTTIAGWDNMPVMYSITRNIDKTLTYTVYFGGDASGKVMQINNGGYNTLTGYTDSERKASFTTTTTYESGTQIKPDHFFFFGGPRIELANEYVVGASNEKPSTAVESVVISHSTVSLMKDETIQLVASVVPSFADDKTLVWSSDDTNIATVDNNGLVTAVAEGATTITATSNNGKTASCVVTVVGALEAATWYGVTTILVKGNPVAVNYSITRTSDRTLTYRTVLSETLTGIFMQLNDGEYRPMTQDATGRIAEWTSTNTYLDGATHSVFFYPEFEGGADRWDVVNYIVGSSNEKPNTLVAFGDQADNTAKIAEYANEVVDAYINRTFPNTDEWYTLCLPFDMDEAQLAATFGAGYTLATLGNSEDRGSLIHLNFNYVNTLEAGKPYLLKPGVSTVIVPMIEDVTIKNVDPSAAPQKAESAHMHFQGTFAPTTLEGDNKRFVGPNNYLYSPAEGGTNMKSFRCYFTIPVESQALVGSKAARIVLGPQVATGMENVQGDQVPSTKVIIDGTLYIIRGERTYNAQGLLVK
ncbi:MAG: discoidin domain-containing protein [Paludibacteraceae bacterium]|nr:discoidin domain-containing protein [Paludibacteraceae bacterium]